MFLLPRNFAFSWCAAVALKAFLLLALFLLPTTHPARVCVLLTPGIICNVVSQAELVGSSEQAYTICHFCEQWGLEGAVGSPAGEFVRSVGCPAATCTLSLQRHVRLPTLPGPKNAATHFLPSSPSPSCLPAGWPVLNGLLFFDEQSQLRQCQKLFVKAGFLELLEPLLQSKLPITGDHHGARESGPPATLHCACCAAPADLPPPCPLPLAPPPPAGPLPPLSSPSSPLPTPAEHTSNVHLSPHPMFATIFGLPKRLPFSSTVQVCVCVCYSFISGS